MADTRHDTSPRAGDRLLLTNLILLLASVCLVSIEWAVVSNRQAVEIGKENRFLTTEWYLLQQLRAQTDAELLKKDQEIASLKRLYQQLKGQNKSEDLAVVQDQLAKAETDRSEILAGSLRAGLRPTQPPPAEATSSSDSPALPSPTTLDLLQRRLTALESQNDGLRARAEAAEAALEAAKALRPAAEVPKPDGSVSRVLSLLAAQKASLGRDVPPNIEELRTRSLVRAILSSPEVKQSYPQLLKAFDDYLEAYGARENARGRVAGYDLAVQQVQSLAPTH